MPPDVQHERNIVASASAVTHSVIIKDLNKIYETDSGTPKMAVKTLSLAIPRSQCVGLLGPNGAGKSIPVVVLDLASMRPCSRLARVLQVKAPPSACSVASLSPAPVLLWSKATTSPKTWTACALFFVCICFNFWACVSLIFCPTRRYTLMSVCPQDNLLWESLTGEEHLYCPPLALDGFSPPSSVVSKSLCRYFYGRLKNLQGAALDAAVDEALQSVNLAEQATRQKLSGEYSGGMKRRLSVAISLIGNPLVVYLDEPSTGLDPASRHQLWEAILKAKKNRTIILTTHSMEEAEVLCDKIGIFVAGELRCYGAPQQLTHRYGSNYSLTATVNPGMVPKAKEFLSNLAPGAHASARSSSPSPPLPLLPSLACSLCRFRFRGQRAGGRHPALQHPHQQHHPRANLLEDGGRPPNRRRSGLGRGKRVSRRRVHSGGAVVAACAVQRA